MGTSGLNYSEVLYAAAQKNLSFAEVFMLPEQVSDTHSKAVEWSWRGVAWRS